MRVCVSSCIYYYNKNRPYCYSKNNIDIIYSKFYSLFHIP